MRITPLSVTKTPLPLSPLRGLSALVAQIMFTRDSLALRFSSEKENNGMSDALEGTAGAGVSAGGDIFGVGTSWLSCCLFGGVVVAAAVFSEEVAILVGVEEANSTGASTTSCVG